MLDIFIQIPSPTFLGYFLLFSIVCIVIGKFWILNDGSKRYKLPSFTNLNPFEIAALRNGRKGVIQTALFDLWHRKLITIGGRGQNLRILDVDLATENPKNQIEQEIYKFACTIRKPAEFFSNRVLRSRINKNLDVINQRLEQLHLKHTKFQIMFAWLKMWLILFIIFSIGGMKIYFSMHYDRPVLFLVILLIIILLIALKILTPKRQTRLGQEYSKKLRKHFKWIKSEENPDIDPAFCVSLFGLSALTSFATSSIFEETFAHSDSPGNSFIGGFGDSSGDSSGGISGDSSGGGSSGGD